jgi:3-hydroxyacyl-CoA dehydrogenase
MDSTTTGVRRVGIIGAGTMGSGIAVSCATAGLAVVLIDTQAAALASGVQRSHAIIDGAVKKGRLTSEAGAAAQARIGTAAQMSALATVDLVIEAVFESLDLKQSIFRALDANCAPGTLLATNTSTLDVDAIAAATARPQDVVGMHFFSPANVMPLIEIVRASKTSAATIATALAATRQLGKIGVVVGNCFGFVGNRMLYGYGRENQLLLLEGIAAERIDAVLEKFGMAMGPNAVGDLAGLDVGYRVRRERKDLPDDPRYFRVADLLVENGRLGQKNGRGMYRYGSDKRVREVDPDVAVLIRAEAARLGVAPRLASDQEILERCLYALINEGAAILTEGIAASAADIDTIWCNGYGFPRTRGGPMAYADTVGLATVYDGVRQLAAAHGARYWQPAALLEQLGSRGSTFAAWSAERELLVRGG